MENENENGSIPIDDLTELAEEIQETVGEATKERSEEELETLKDEHGLNALEVTDRTLPFQTITTPNRELLFVAPVPKDLSLADFDMSLNNIGNLDVILIYEDGLGHLVEYEIGKEQVDRVNENNKIIPVSPARYEELVEEES
jgi:hypothetical protein